MPGYNVVAPPFATGYPVGAFGLSWSPDGSTLAVATTRFCGPEATLTGDGSTVTVTAFVSTRDGKPLTPPRRVALHVAAGWRLSDTLIGEQIRPDGRYGLAEGLLWTDP